MPSLGALAPISIVFLRVLMASCVHSVVRDCVSALWVCLSTLPLIQKLALLDHWSNGWVLFHWGLRCVKEDKAGIGAAPNILNTLFFDWNYTIRADVALDGLFNDEGIAIGRAFESRVEVACRILEFWLGPGDWGFLTRFHILCLPIAELEHLEVQNEDS